MRPVTRVRRVGMQPEECFRVLHADGAAELRDLPLLPRLRPVPGFAHAVGRNPPGRDTGCVDSPGHLPRQARHGLIWDWAFRRAFGHQKAKRENEETERERERKNSE